MLEQLRATLVLLWRKEETEEGIYLRINIPGKAVLLALE